MVALYSLKKKKKCQRIILLLFKVGEIVKPVKLSVISFFYYDVFNDYGTFNIQNRFPHFNLPNLLNFRSFPLCSFNIF